MFQRLSVLLNRLSLRGRVFIVLVALGMISLVGGGAMIWYTYQMEGLFQQTIEANMLASHTVEDLLQALIKQKGFVSYYFMDGDPSWLERLELYRRAFNEHLDIAEKLPQADDARKALEEIKSEYGKYIETKDRVIELYKSGEREMGLQLHQDVRDHFFEILARCETYKAIHSRRIHLAHEKSQAQADQIRYVAATVILTTIFLTILFAFVLLTQILDPIRRLAAEADHLGGEASSINEVRALRHGVRGLIQDAEQTQTELQKSRTRLLHTEKMATVGKMAAGVAHSIRNPMTSIKLRLYSLERALQLSATQEEDFEVISEEIRHIDNIVQNFLQYSRPSKLKMQRISPSDIVDTSIQLVRHRFKSYGIEVDLKQPEWMPEILADPDQLKEVFVNVLVNASEAMVDGGLISIEEEVNQVEPLGLAVIIKIRDNGHGIPAAIQEKVFDPFYSTKEEGTGLGLSISVQIIEQHRGLLDLKSEEGEGTIFTISLPCQEDISWV